MTKNTETSIDQLIQQHDLLQELTTILEQTDKTILVDMLKILASPSIDAEQSETLEDFSSHINSKLIAAFYAAHKAAGGRGPSEAVLKALNIKP